MRGPRGITALVILAASMPAFAQQPAAVISNWTLLWPAGAPGALGSADADRPAIAAFLPAGEKRNRSAVLVCPGGGYQNLALDHEGKQVAEWLNSLGMAAFVLRYRLGPRYHHPVMLQDAQRGLRFVRSKAADYGIAPDRIGFWGFSAGGHLPPPPGLISTPATRPPRTRSIASHVVPIS